MFWTLKSVNLTALLPIFLISFAYSLAAFKLNSLLLAPVITIFPVLKINAVVLGSFRLMITAANLLGLNSAFLHFCAISLRSS